MDQQGYLPVPTFDYSSAFNYRSFLSEDFDSPDDSLRIGAQSRAQSGPAQQLAYYLITTLSFLFFLLTVPISYFFCVKKVSALQRCLTYRLGNRLPLKGPGYILKLPFIDNISIIDLYEERFNIIESDEQILTSDGSIIVMRPCQASLNVTNAVLTTLKIGQVDVKQCLRLRFGNVVRSKHVEDLENKMHFVVKQFEENCNKFLQRWGYAFKIDELPRLTVVERADPINPIKTKLTQLFKPDEANPTSPAEALLSLLVPMTPSTSAATSKQVHFADTNNQQLEHALTEHELSRTIPVMQSFLEQYKAFLQGVDLFSMQFIIEDTGSTGKQRHHYFQYSNDCIQSVPTRPNHIHMTVRLESYANFELFLASKDTKYVQYSFD